MNLGLIKFSLLWQLFLEKGTMGKNKNFALITTRNKEGRKEGKEAAGAANSSNLLYL